jgi:hypothetical protein
MDVGSQKNNTNFLSLVWMVTSEETGTKDRERILDLPMLPCDCLSPSSKLFTAQYLHGTTVPIRFLGRLDRGIGKIR